MFPEDLFFHLRRFTDLSGYHGPVNATPDWLSYATPAVALLALMVSAIALGVSVATYRRAGPRVKVRVWAPRGWKETDERLHISITAWNSGLAPVQVVGIRLATPFGDKAPLYELVNFNEVDRVEGPQLKAVLSPGTEETWVFDAFAALTRRYGGIESSSNTVEQPGSSRRGRLGSTIKRLYKKWLMAAHRTPIRVYVVLDLGNGVQVASRKLLEISMPALLESSTGKQKLLDGMSHEG